MNLNEITMWLMTIISLTLAITLYLRVDIHDWGMVGLTIFVSGASVLMVRWVARTYGWVDDASALLVLWRFLVVLGGPLALAGFLMSFWRDPPPRRQVAMRLAWLLTITLELLMVVMGVCANQLSRAVIAATRWPTGITQATSQSR